MTSPAKTTVWKRLYRCRRGAAIIEFAITAPLLLALSLGVFELGRAVQSLHMIDKGMRDAARYLGRGFATCDTNGNFSYTNGTQAQNLALYGNTSGSGTTVLGFWSDPNTIAISGSCVAASTNWISLNGSGYVPTVTVTATVPYPDLGFLQVLGISGLTFNTQHQEISIPD